MRERVDDDRMMECSDNGRMLLHLKYCNDCDDADDAVEKRRLWVGTWCVVDENEETDVSDAGAVDDEEV